MKAKRANGNCHSQLRSKIISRLLPFAVLVCLIGYCPKSAHADQPSDYLVQEVCDDGNGGHTGQDPFLCPNSARKLRVGETLPYHKWNAPFNTSDTAQHEISDSYQILDLFNHMRVIQTEYFDYMNGSFDNPTYKASRTTPNNVYGGAYDAIGGDGSYFNIMITTDTGGGWQPIWSSSPPSCSLNDSWILFSTSGDPTTFNNDVTENISINPQCDPDSGAAQSITHYSFYSGFTYTSGKSLDTIKTFHFGANSYNAPGIEMFYFTKQYGKTRWEYWAAASSQYTGPNQFAMSSCPTGANGGVEVFAQTTYYLQACQDWSNIGPASSVGTGADWDPSASWHIDPLLNSINFLSNTHLQCTDSNGNSGSCANGSGASCQTIAPWNRAGDLNWGFDPDPQHALAAGTGDQNCAWLINLPDTYVGQAIYQDAPVYSGTYAYTYGAAIWNPYSGQGDETAIIAVYELDSNGSVVASHYTQASGITDVAQYYSGSFTSSPQSSTFRFVIYPQNVGGVYEFTESWVGFQP